MLTALPIVALSAAPGRFGAPGAGRVFAIIGIMIVFVVVCGLIVMQIRKRLLTDDASASPPLLLEELRAMHRRGELSDQEFEATRRRIVARLSISSAPALSAQPPRGERPMKAIRPLNRRPAPGEQHAPPGFDLTGEPLPTPAPPPGGPDSPRPGGEDPRPANPS